MAQPVHQQTSVGALQRGDEVAMEMTEGLATFYHHAIVESVDPSVGTVNVIHRVPDEIERGVYDERSHGPFYVVIHNNRHFNRQQTYDRARQRLGEEGYDLRDQNCEHFTNWCVMGEDRSYQAEARWFACTFCKVVKKKKAKKTKTKTKKKTS